MPTPRAHGGAALAHIPMVAPGFMGLNTEQASGLLGPEWATVLMNATLDANGRVAARKGFNRAFGGPGATLTYTITIDSAAYTGAVQGMVGWQDGDTPDYVGTLGTGSATGTVAPLEIIGFAAVNTSTGGNNNQDAISITFRQPVADGAIASTIFTSVEFTDESAVAQSLLRTAAMDPAGSSTSDGTYFYRTWTWTNSPSSDVLAVAGSYTITVNTASSGAPDIVDQFTNIGELVQSDGTTALFGHAGTALYVSTDDGSTWSDITGTATPTAGAVTAFHNFNDKIVALQAGQAPALSDGTSFVAVTDVNAPLGLVGCSAFGRMWIAAANGHDLRYSALLDATDWTSTDSGVLDLWNVWPGNDTITAVVQFNGALVVFGRRCIVVWTDGAGSALGIDPVSMYVVDVIQGVGCISQFSVQHVDGDLWFLSEFGLQSLGRLIQEKSNPIENLSKNVQGSLQAAVELTPEANIRSAYSPRDRVYLLSLPSGGTSETGRCHVFDTRQRLPDGAARCVGTWTLVPNAIVVRKNGEVGMQVFSTVSANYGTYDGQLDDTYTYVLDYESGWMDLTQQGYLIFPKRYSGVFFSDNDITVNFKYALDFSDSFITKSKSFVGAGAAAEWGEAEWNVGEFGGGVSLHSGQVTGARSGEYIKLGLTCTINNTIMAVQQLDIFCKVGRIA